MTQARLSPALDSVLVATFLLAVAVPLVGTVAGWDHDDTTEEHREATPRPSPPRDLASLAAWPEAFTKYYADRFAFRSRLVRWQARVRVGLLKASPTPDVLLGRDRWLFYANDGAVEDYTGAKPFTAPELEQWRSTLQHTQDWLDERGIQYVFVLAPDKHWIYPERMPDGIHGRLSPTRLDQLVDYLRRHSTVNIVDTREDLAASASAQRLYHLTDTHWNDQGAFIAYRQVMAVIGPPLHLQARAPEDMEARVIPRSGFDLARMLGLGRVLVEEDLQLEPHRGRRSRVVEPSRPSRGLMVPRVVTEGPAVGPRAVIFRDSFGSAMIPFLSEHFSRAVYLWQTNFDPGQVTLERPDVVIQEWVGRHLHTVRPFDGVAAMSSASQQ
jgi:alginate O-acetyltransferase complex protein AlgJ